MSILLTEQEVVTAWNLVTEDDCAGINVAMQDFARAVQLALIEKLRKEPVAQYTRDKYGFEIGFTGDPDLPPMGEHQLFRLPTPQELEEEKC